MAEESDTLLMNFSLGAEPIHTLQKFKGGRWRERRGLKRPSHLTGVNAQDVIDRPTKRPRTDDRARVDGQSEPPRRSAPPNGIVSSLFSFNPEAQSVLEEVKVEETTTSPSNAPLIDGIDTFTSLGLSPIVAVHLLTKMELKAPTAIQKAAVSQLLKENSDAFVQAETGSGKTLAYLLPIIHHLILMSQESKKMTNAAEQGIHRDSGLFAIILAPTRELSKQISTVLESLLGCARWIVSGTVIGGEKKKSEKARLRKGLNILVATPGRLVDHLRHTEVLDVSSVRWLVLDEGDRLMELGFEEDIKSILAKLDQNDRKDKPAIPALPSRRTTILCSATMRANVNKLGEMSLKDAIHIQAGSIENQISVDGNVANEQAFSAPAQLKQSYCIVPAKQRLVTLYAILKRSFSRKGSIMKAITFFTCADSVDFHYEVFSRQQSQSMDSEQSSESPSSKSAPMLSSPGNPDVTLYKLYGNMTQQLRTATLKAFSLDKNPSILLCTDIASRGLDLPSIDLVVEYDPAFSVEEHLHRIGRTARAGRDGSAIVFLMPGPEEGYVSILKQSLKDNSLHGSTSEDALQKAFSPAVASESNKTWEDSATDWQLEAERWIQADRKVAELARRAFVGHVRAYATHSIVERSVFDVKELHLGHLAKAFALREKPSNMGRGNSSKDLRGRSNGKRNRTRVGGQNANKDDVEAARGSAVSPIEAAKQMRKALNAINPASEFNIA